MTFELTNLYRNGNMGNWSVNKETSVPEREVSEEDANKWMEFFELKGCKKGFHKNQIIYFEMHDGSHATEYCFRK